MSGLPAFGDYVEDCPVCEVLVRSSVSSTSKKPTFPSLARYVIKDGAQYIRRDPRFGDLFTCHNDPARAERFATAQAAQAAIDARNKAVGETRQFMIVGYVNGCTCDLCKPFDKEI